MKRILSLLIKFGLFAAIIFIAVKTNPQPTKHKQAIEAKHAYLEGRDVLGKTERMIYGKNSNEDAVNPYSYHNYWLGSKVTGPDKETVSFGFLGRVFVTKSEL